MPAQITVEGLKDLQKKAEQMVRDMSGSPMVTAMREATLRVTADAKRPPAMPVDTGRLKASITPEVVTEGKIVRGIVGSNVTYAPYQELGTGTFVGRPRHFPPPSALETWAKRHGMGSGYVVARAIFLKGGLRPRRFLQGAIEKNAAKIHELLSRAVDKIAGK